MGPEWFPERGHQSSNFTPTRPMMRLQGRVQHPTTEPHQDMTTARTAAAQYSAGVPASAAAAAAAGGAVSE